MTEERYRLVTLHGPKRIWCLTTITARPLRNPAIAGNHLIDPDAPSATRVVYDYYGGRDRFPNISPELMAAVDQADSAQYSLEEILHPRGWVLLNFLMDSRTGLGRFRNFRISNYQLMMQLIDACQVPHDQADRVVEQLVGQLNATNPARV